MLLDFGADCKRVSSQFGLKADEHADAVGMVECARAIRAREEGVRDAIAKARRAVEELCNALESTNTLESEVVSNAVASGANGTAEELVLSRLEKAIDAVAEAHGGCERPRRLCAVADGAAAVAVAGVRCCANVHIG